MDISEDEVWNVTLIPGDGQGFGGGIISMGKSNSGVVRHGSHAGEIGIFEILSVSDNHFTETRSDRFGGTLVNNPLLKRVGGELEFVVLIFTILNL